VHCVPFLVIAEQRTGTVRLLLEGWTIQQETESNIIAAIPKDYGSPCSKITVHIVTGYFEVYCECDTELSLQQLIDNQKTVEQYFDALDNQLEGLPP